jgi:plastocyanin
MQHLDTLDSRVLRLTDAYGQRFMREGRFAWAALPAGGGMLSVDRPFTIDVGPRRSDGKMTQHHVELGWDGQRFRPDRPKLAIEAGDLVSWHCPDPAAPGFEIAGDQPFFGSAALVNECGYSHAFGVPGRYRWVDALGSGLSGTVHVRPVSCATRDELAKWRARLAQAELVMIQHAKADRDTVEIVVGQTVYFAVVTGPGITITDERLVVAQQGCAAPRKAA